MLTGVGDGSRATNELRIGSVSGADASQPPEDIGHMGTENASVGMRFINHHKLELTEEGSPRTMIRQNAKVQHIRIGKDYSG